MRKLILLIFFSFLLEPLFPQNRMSLDTAIKDFAVNFTSMFLENRRIAVISFESDKRDLTIHFIDSMIMDLLEGNKDIEVYERQKIEILQKELDFSLTLRVSDETVQRIGHFVGADTVVYGSIRKISNKNEYQMTITATTVETGRILSQKLYDLRNDSRLKGFYANNSSNKIILGKDTHFWTVGGFVGTSFAEPWVIGTINGTLAPFAYSFLEVGIDIGFISGNPNVVSYYSLYPYAHYAFFLPFNKVSLYAGLGIGYMIGERSYSDYVDPIRIIAADGKIGLNFGNVFDISYTLKTNFQSVNNKISLGYTYRFDKE